MGLGGVGLTVACIGGTEALEKAAAALVIGPGSFAAAAIAGLGEFAAVVMAGSGALAAAVADRSGMLAVLDTVAAARAMDGC